jgi:hypothetical protein
MKSLIFIYNAKSDGISKAFDFAHKIISPKTYSCDLCSLTHGNFGERKAWIEFQENSSIKMKFYHKDEFEKEFKTSYDYPVILTNKLNLFISKNEINKIDSVQRLIELIKTKI